jgi:hypothetical protein
MVSHPRTSRPLLALLLAAVACGDAGPAATAEPAVARIVISGSPPLQLFVTETHQLAATAYDREGQLIDGTTVGWRSGDERIVHVDQGGLLTAIDAGGTQVFARSGAVSDSISVSVFEQTGETEGGGR